MLKKVIVSFLALLMITGCGCEKKEDPTDNRIYLSSKYYNNGGVYLDIKSETLDELENDNYVLYTYNPYCSFEIPCDEIFKVFMEKYKVSFLSIPFSEFKKTKFYESVKYGPTVLIVSKGNIIAYLDANSNFDLAKYQKAKEFETWIKKYVFVVENKGGNMD